MNVKSLLTNRYYNLINFWRSKTTLYVFLGDLGCGGGGGKGVIISKWSIGIYLEAERLKIKGDSEKTNRVQF